VEARHDRRAPGPRDVVAGVPRRHAVDIPPARQGRVPRWHPVDAAAVVFSFERLLDPKHPHYLSGQDAVYRRSLLRSITKLVALDPGTVEIHVARPYAPLLGDLAMYPLVSPAAVAAWGDTFKEHPVGTGPFKFEAWNKGEHVVVRRFDRYWGAKPAIDRIVFRVIVDARQRLVELESGSVDLATSIPPRRAAVRRSPSRPRPLRDARQRRQLPRVQHTETAVQRRPRAPRGELRDQQGADRQARVPGARDRSGWTVATRAVGLPHAEDPLPVRPRARAQATRRGDRGQDVRSERTYNLYSLSTPRPYLSQPERVARFLQSALAQVGIKTRLELLPYAAHKHAVESGRP